MKSSQKTLYSFGALIPLLPVLNFQFGQIPGWFVGEDFRLLLSEVINQAFTTLADAAIISIFQTIFGVSLV